MKETFQIMSMRFRKNHASSDHSHSNNGRRAFLLHRPSSARACMYVRCRDASISLKFISSQYLESQLDSAGSNNQYVFQVSAIGSNANWMWSWSQDAGTDHQNPWNK